MYDISVDPAYCRFIGAGFKFYPFAHHSSTPPVNASRPSGQACQPSRRSFENRPDRMEESIPTALGDLCPARGIRAGMQNSNLKTTANAPKRGRKESP
jgi:hypothetical protein